MATATQKLLRSFDPKRAGELCRELLAGAPWPAKRKD